jgi:pyruvate/2-oxoacid:ferredoxin oxidoreductase alpha subunit
MLVARLDTVDDLIVELELVRRGATSSRLGAKPRLNPPILTTNVYKVGYELAVEYNLTFEPPNIYLEKLQQRVEQLLELYYGWTSLKIAEFIVEDKIFDTWKKLVKKTYDDVETAAEVRENALIEIVTNGSQTKETLEELKTLFSPDKYKWGTDSRGITYLQEKQP